MDFLKPPSISIIIPTYNESGCLPDLLSRLSNSMEFGMNNEIIVSDGGSSDNTVALAKEFKATVITGQKGRAKQMNAAARLAQGEILYFLHADSRTPSDFIGKIVQAHTKGYQAGCFRLRFDWNHWFLELNAWFTRFDINAVRFGDQSLFITKKLFDQIGGFRDDYVIMEDHEIIRRIARHTSFAVLSDFIITSARKYRINGAYRMQIIFFYIYGAYAFGASQETLKKLYSRLIRA